MSTEREQHAAQLVEEIAPSDEEIGTERFAAVQQATGASDENYITTHATLAEALSYHGDSVLDGWEPLSVVDLDTGERFEVEVKAPRVIVSPDPLDGLRDRIADFKHAASRLNSEWEHHAGDAVANYPSYLPSFDEFSLAICAMEVRADMERAAQAE